MADTPLPGLAVPPHVPAHLVRNWDFDAAPGAHQDPYAANRALLDGPEVIYSPLLTTHWDKGSWVVSRAAHIREAFLDTETFSSRRAAGIARLLSEDWDLLPLEKDPPDHARYRALLNPLFGPAQVNALDAGIRETAAGLIATFDGAGGCEFERDFGRPFSVTVFLRLMGLPLDHMDRFVGWERALLRGAGLVERVRAAFAIKHYLLDAIAFRRRRPTDDLISAIVSSRIDDHELSDDEVLGLCYVLFVGGLDTVAAMLGFAFKHLAGRPEDQRLLRTDPDLIGDAVEELIRAHAVVSSARYVSRDVDFHGAPMKAGDRVLLVTPLGGRDPGVFPEPDRIDFRRRRLPHTSFGVGPHHCLGSHLARRELRIALEEWTRRLPEFRLKPGEPPLTHAGAVWGVSRLPLVWS